MVEFAEALERRSTLFSSAVHERHILKCLGNFDGVVGLGFGSQRSVETVEGSCVVFEGGVEGAHVVKGIGDLEDERQAVVRGELVAEEERFVLVNGIGVVLQGQLDVAENVSEDSLVDEDVGELPGRRSNGLGGWQPSSPTPPLTRRWARPPAPGS